MSKPTGGRVGRPYAPRILRLCADECGRAVVRPATGKQPKKVRCASCLARRAAGVLMDCRDCGQTFTQTASLHFSRCVGCRTPRTVGQRGDSAVQRSCEWCSETFDAYEPPSRPTPVRFCSNEHRLLWFSREYRGANSPHWRGGTHPYGSYWRALTRAISVRDGGRCRCCGKTEEEAGERHTAAHLIPERAWPEVAVLRHHPANLVALCRTCHAQFDRNPATRYDYATGVRPHWPYWTAQPVGLKVDQARWLVRLLNVPTPPEVDEDGVFRKLIDELNASPGACGVYGMATPEERQAEAAQS